MKILFVAMADSIHTARWINQIAENHKKYLFPSINSSKIHPDIKDVIFCDKYYLPVSKLFKFNNFDTTVKEFIVLHYLKSAINLLNLYLHKIIAGITDSYEVIRLIKTIEEIKPDIIHSLEMQSGGYLVNKARKISKNKFPIWIVSNWGSDIYYYMNFKNHLPIIKDILQHCGYYICECNRDVLLARNLGFRGKVLGVIPNAGGYHLDKYIKYRKTQPSRRKTIMVKGYQGWAGRSLTALKAIDSIGKELSSRKIGITLYSTQGNKKVESEARRIAFKHKLSLKIIPQNTPHRDILKSHGKAIISIGLSISDGISTSLLEAMSMGSFPIQSYTACADEWIINGITGYLVSPTDYKIVATSIMKAIESPKLIDKAAIINQRSIAERASHQTISVQVDSIYSSFVNTEIQ